MRPKVNYYTKGNLKDLEKARDYLNFEIEKIKEELWN